MSTSLERTLFTEYYESRHATADMSSHWLDLSGHFRVEVDTAGRLHAHGTGFGTCHWNGTVHRVFDTATRLVHLAHLPGRARLLELHRVAARLVTSAGLDPTFDVFRQVCTVALLESFLELHTTPQRFLLIGDGYGMLGALLKARYPNAQIVYVDLGRTLLFQAHHVPRAQPQCTHAVIAPGVALPAADFLYCPSDRVAAIEGLDVDLAVNIASMQEMTPAVIASYFRLLRRCLRPKNLFYCCNRERKQMPGGEVSEFRAFPWRTDDDVLIDGPCPWHQYFLSVRGRTAGPALLGVPVPFVRYYDGPHRHRLAVLKTDS